MARHNTDSNHVEIADAFRSMGASVADHYKVGGGEPDLAIGAYGIDQGVEVKTATGALEDSQIKFFRDWKGRRIVIVRTIDQAHAVIRQMAADAKRFRLHA